MTIQTFKDHLENPKHAMKPSFFQASISYQLSLDNWVKIYLDIDNKDRINQFAYEYQGIKGLIPYFSALSLMTKGLTLIEASELSNEDYYDFFEEDEVFINLMESGYIPLIELPLILLKEAINQYTGEEIFENSKTQELVCRCFGVYESDIKSLIENERSFELIDVMKKTCVGGGCGSCMGDVEAIYHNARLAFPQIQKPGSLTENSGKLTTAQWVMKFDEEINKFKIQNGLAELDVEIMKFKFPELRLKIHNKPNELDPSKLKDKMEFFLYQNLQLKIDVNFLN